jgi:hypothetical protein
MSRLLKEHQERSDGGQESLEISHLELISVSMIW